MKTEDVAPRDCPLRPGTECIGECTGPGCPHASERGERDKGAWMGSSHLLRGGPGLPGTERWSTFTNLVLRGWSQEEINEAAVFFSRRASQPPIDAAALREDEIQKLASEIMCVFWGRGVNPEHRREVVREIRRAVSRRN